MHFFLVLLISGQLAAAYGPAPGQAFGFETRLECEAKKIEQLRDIRQKAPQALEDPEMKIKCVDEPTFDRLNKGETDPGV